MQDVLGLQQGILYGPVGSRRLGLSLGLNLMPDKYKLCPFNCVYCQYGWSRVHTRNLECYTQDLPTPEAVEEALTERLRSGVETDFITFSDNGESSVHPGFPEILERVTRVRDRYLPSARTCILSNAAGAVDARVRESITRVDLPILKLDAGDEATFNEINRPCPGLRFEDILEGLRRCGRFHTQTLFVDGAVENISREKRERWLQLLTELRPEQAQIYSLDRPPAASGLKRVPLETLERFAREAVERTGVPVKAW